MLELPGSPSIRLGMRNLEPNILQGICLNTNGGVADLQFFWLVTVNFDMGIASLSWATSWMFAVQEKTGLMIWIWSLETLYSSIFN